MRKLKGRWMHPCGCADCQLHPYSQAATQHRAINRVLVTLDKRNRRRFVGLLAIQWGRRSLTPLALITGLSRNTIRRGKRESEHPIRRLLGRRFGPGDHEAGTLLGIDILDHTVVGKGKFVSLKERGLGFER